MDTANTSLMNLLSEDTPDLVRHCVNAVVKKGGHDVNSAFAICVAQMQKSGFVEPGSLKLTAAGKGKEKEHETEPDEAKKLASYEKILAKARVSRSEGLVAKLTTIAEATSAMQRPARVKRLIEARGLGESAWSTIKGALGAAFGSSPADGGAKVTLGTEVGTVSVTVQEDEEFTKLVARFAELQKSGHIAETPQAETDKLNRRIGYIVRAVLKSELKRIVKKGETAASAGKAESTATPAGAPLQEGRKSVKVGTMRMRTIRGKKVPLVKVGMDRKGRSIWVWAGRDSHTIGAGPAPAANVAHAPQARAMTAAPGKLPAAAAAESRRTDGQPALTNETAAEQYQQLRSRADRLARRVAALV